MVVRARSIGGWFAGAAGAAVASAMVLVLVLVQMSGVTAASAQRVEEDTFENIKNSASEQMVAFYHSSDSTHFDTLKIMKKAAKKLRNDMPNFRFRKCDCDLEVNRKECSDASFNSGTFLFTATQNEGIEKYSLAVNAKTIAKYIRGKAAAHDFADVLPFTNEDAFYERMDLSEEPKPILVKFFETWCQHCKRAKIVCLMTALPDHCTTAPLHHCTTAPLHPPIRSI